MHIIYYYIYKSIYCFYKWSILTCLFKFNAIAIVFPEIFYTLLKMKIKNKSSVNNCYIQRSPL